MTNLRATVPLTQGSRADHVFPTLTAAQVARVATHGRRREVQPGEVLIEVGDSAVPFFLVTAGQVEIVRPGTVETIITVHGQGEFTGEANMLSGRRTLVTARASTAGEVVELSRDQLLALVQMDPELGEILMRAFILRRVELIASGIGDAVLIGSTHSSGTLRIREFLTRNGHPYTYIDLDRDPDVQALLDRFDVAVTDVPVLLVCGGEAALRNPTNQQIAKRLGFNDAIDETHIRDLVVVGAGPSGLAAAVYGASEGLDVLVVESNAPGGQAGASSWIENYLGFPTGISGQELAGRAYTQAEKFGAQVLIAKDATELTCDRKPYSIAIDGGPAVPARAVIIATGAEYRRLPIENLSQFEGSGVYYGATFVEAQLCGGEEVIVVGGGNSAGQAAVFLAQTARRVQMLVRSGGLADSMSRYLIRRIEDNPAIVLRTRTEIVGLEGDGRVERVLWRNTDTGVQETSNIRHVFVMTGAIPNTGWLHRCVALDGNGFIKTGPDLTADDLATARWPLARAPHLLETSLPGVFAVGDVRGGNIKRVASAVGEGSIAVAFVHRVLQE